MGKEHEIRKEAAHPKSEIKARDTRKKIIRKETPPVRKSIEKYMDLWKSAMGDSLQLQH
jgi:hypothetical protein